MQQSGSIIKTERRFAKYINSGNNDTQKNEKHSGVVDLSEGPKLNYDAKFGPKNLDFDFKIINPY